MFSVLEFDERNRKRNLENKFLKQTMLRFTKFWLWRIAALYTNFSSIISTKLLHDDRIAMFIIPSISIVKAIHRKAHNSVNLQLLLFVYFSITVTNYVLLISLVDTTNIIYMQMNGIIIELALHFVIYLRLITEFSVDLHDFYQLTLRCFCSIKNMRLQHFVSIDTMQWSVNWCKISDRSHLLSF